MKAMGQITTRKSPRARKRLLNRETDVYINDREEQKGKKKKQMKEKENIAIFFLLLLFKV